MGSGNNSTPVTSGLLRRRYSVPEIIMRKHSLAQQKIYDESVAATAPSPYRSPGPVYYKSYSTSTPTRSYPISSGSDSNLSRRLERGEMSMRKSTLLRRIWSRELKRYDTRSGSWSPPMRRSQRRLHAEPVESLRCEECRKLDDDQSDESEDAASRKRLRLISIGREPSDETYAPKYCRSVSKRVQITTSSSLESSPLTNGRAENVHIYMTPMKQDRSISEPSDQGQDMLHVEIDLDNSEENGNSLDNTEQPISADENQNETEVASRTTDTTTTSENGNGDSPLDRFISKLLIDNLSDLADEINEQFENNNNLAANESSPKSKRVSAVYFSPEHMKAVVTRCQTSEDPLSNSTSAHEIPGSNMTKSDESGHEQIIYFPSCSLECKDDMSSYTSNCSDFELNNVHSSDVIKVSTGSTYPVGEQKEALVIPRMLGSFPRTESLEAQHSLTSVLDDENGNNSDDSISLVDSLDDPQNSANNEDIAAEKQDVSEENALETRDEDASSVCWEKPEAFFVPITGSELEESQSVPVARAMPEKLKEKILQRQRELDTKREEELKKKQKKIERIMDRKLDEENFCEKSPVRCKNDSPVKEKPPIPKKSEHAGKKSTTKGNAVLLRSEIGLLECYTIDSKGNMQFKAPQKTDSSVSSSTTTTTTSTTTTTTTTSKKTNSSRPPITRKRAIVQNKPPEISQQSLDKKTSTSKTKSKKSVVKDVQKMTIFQAQSDIITPDLENGPRRVYQKTEIQDGEKRIEILEIVECIETSPETSPDRQYTYRCTSKSALTRRSKIPIPIYKMGRSAGFQKSPRCCSSREACPTATKNLARNLQGTSSNKVDRAIAELLIDALNRPEEMGIEIVRSPKDVSRDKSTRRQVAQRRNTPRRSANSGKYQQVFEVIPEEKSSFSVDSSADEPSRTSKSKLESASSKLKSSNTNSSSAIATKDQNTSGSETKTEATITYFTTSSSPVQKTSNSGKVAVDQAEPKAWIGFFKRHNDSSMDEDDSPSEQYPSSSVETSYQNTITTPSTNTAAAGSTTPKPISSAGCITSAESDNVLKLIEKTFHNEEPEKPSSSEYNPKSTATTVKTSTTSEVFSKTRKTRKIKEIENPLNVAEAVLKIELKQAQSTSQSSNSSTAEASSDPQDSQTRKKVPLGHRAIRKPTRPDVWRVQSPDICKMAIPNFKNKSKSEEEPTTETTAEIDSRSFIIVTDDCNSSPSRLNYSSKIPVIGNDSSESTTSFLTNKCTTCCFCNPELHKSIKNTASTPCVYCNRKRTPPKREEETNTEPDFFRNHQVYQSMTKSDHTHIRTRSRDSDVVSTKCTKINERIKKFIPETGTATTTTTSQDPKSKAPKNLSRPKNVANLPKRVQGTVHKITQDNLKPKELKTKIASPDGKTFRFPSPYANLSSSFDRTTSPSSSSDSTCPTTPSRCPLLPATRRQNFASTRTNSKKRNSKDEEPIQAAINNVQNNSDNTNNNNGNGSVKVNGQNNGWSVTVAGSYSQDLAPDLEMRLSFPKPAGHFQQAIASNPVLNEQRDFHRFTNGNMYTESLYNDDEDIVNDNYSRTNHHLHPALPPAINMNPKRALTRIVSERTHSQRDINFPEVASSRNPMVSRQMAKKAIKHTECSVAVTSATRTISNFTRGRRTMSYQALNTESHRMNNRDRHSIRDNSLDLGNLSSRRMSLDSQQTPTECMMALSIMGNAIAPEQKPRVPTMSEKDLTRRHNGCFTRNRAFFT